MTALPLTLLDDRFAASTLALPTGARVIVRRCVGARVQRDGQPTFVLLHGISSGAASWLHCALALSEFGHVIAWDAPGYGESSALQSATPTVDDYAARLDQTLQALDIDSCVLVGHSLGALMGAAYARTLGAGTVSNLVLISPAGGYGTDEQTAARLRVRRQRRDDLQTLGIDGIAARTPDRLLSPNASDAARDWVKWNTSRLNAGGYLQAVELLCGANLGRSAGLAMPVQVYCGDADIVTPPDACERWAQILNATFAPIHAAGHASPVEQPEAVARLIASEGHPSRRPAHD